MINTWGVQSSQNSIVSIKIMKHGVNNRRNHGTVIIFYQAIFFYQYRQYRTGGGVCLFVKESFSCKTRQEWSINCDAIKSLCLEITNEKLKNINLNLTYRPPSNDVREFEKHFK